MVNVNQLMKQAQMMQKKMADMQEQLAHTEYLGSSGAGAVNITINGQGKMVKLKLEASLLVPEDVEVLEDLIIAAFNDAKKKAESDSEGNMSGMLGGMGLPPGFKLPF